MYTWLHRCLFQTLVVVHVIFGLVYLIRRHWVLGTCLSLDGFLICRLSISTRDILHSCISIAIIGCIFLVTRIFKRFNLIIIPSVSTAAWTVVLVFLISCHLRTYRHVLTAIGVRNELPKCLCFSSPPLLPYLSSLVFVLSPAEKLILEIYLVAVGARARVQRDNERVVEAENVILVANLSA